MVDPIQDLKTLRDDIRHHALNGLDPTPDRVQQWADCASYLAVQLQLPRCPECGGPMSFNPELQADVCSHPEDAVPDH